MNEEYRNEITEEQEQRAFEQQLEQWRKEYFSIYMTEVSDIHFVWRGLSRTEFRVAMDMYEDDYDRAEYVCSLCVLEPIIEDYSAEIYGGIPETLAELILEESGFTKDANKLNQLMKIHQREMMSFENQVSCIIKEVFNEYTIEEIENWTLEKTMWYYSRAEWTLKNLRGIELEMEDDGVPQIPNS